MQAQRHHSRNRLQKDEVKEDEFLTWIYSVVGYAEQNYAKIIAGVGVVVVMVLVGMFVKSSYDKAEQASVDAIGEVQLSLMQGDLAGAISRAERVVREHSGQPAAAQAQMLLGSAYFEQKRFDEARAAFQKYLDEYGSDGPQGYGAWAGIAACMVEQQNASGAAQRYIDYADQHPGSPFVPLSLFEAAKCYEFASNTGRQVEVLKRIVSEYPESQARREAETELRMLGENVG